jgi:hypothetical protein
MLTCLALALGVSFAELPSLAAEVEDGARQLSAQAEVTATFLADVREFSADAERFSVSLRELGVEQDLPCIFHGIAEDALIRAEELNVADTATERDAAFTSLRALLDDAILIAPIAAAAAQDRAAEHDIARR